jgi:hypothetical protein
MHMFTSHTHLLQGLETGRQVIVMSYKRKKAGSSGMEDDAIRALPMCKSAMIYVDVNEILKTPISRPFADHGIKNFSSLQDSRNFGCRCV